MILVGTLLIGLATVVLLTSTIQLCLTILGERIDDADTRCPPFRETPLSRFILLVPAHDEGADIADTVGNLRSLDYPPSLVRTIVVADNCTDSTGLFARRAGAEVWVRVDSERLGKGFALAWALESVTRTQHDAVVVLDADTIADPNLLRVLDDELRKDEEAKRTVAYQVRYRFHAEGHAWASNASINAKDLEHRSVHHPRMALGLPVVLQGNGFCLPKSVLKAVPWRADSIAEDMEYTLDLMMHRIAVRYIDRVSISARLPALAAHCSSQRIRWAKGNLHLLFTRLSPLAYRALRFRDTFAMHGALLLLCNSRVTTAYALIFTFGGLILAPPAFRAAIVSLIGLSAAAQAAILIATRSSRDHSALEEMKYATRIASAQWQALVHLRQRVWTRTER
ncbi:glycosyltransferase family 2 protein [Terriglobus roseus]|uniref:Glycosyltransferase, catalytic subunit of cellulose synthase and poly-beta-1,6-N-acetylglucosamine synthase n=1 Tax=Terriglobus roseus TaxID=392734 RepID=A0A1H4SIV0_9BACT|nr:glycosyltransferase family 2 protein [Terriglobus roseus]SEC44135.1 Glycosyltransferase, catalytic subunit of cellulose synthase and poly-beta-1,6-N-acetylglucosamine synthase [Terriglobus roseus]